MRHKLFLFIAIFLLGASYLSAQNLALKGGVNGQFFELYIPEFSHFEFIGNVGAEIGVESRIGPRWNALLTLRYGGIYKDSGFQYGRLQQWSVNPEIRYYTLDQWTGWYFNGKISLSTMNYQLTSIAHFSSEEEHRNGNTTSMSVALGLGRNIFLGDQLYLDLHAGLGFWKSPTGNSPWLDTGLSVGYFLTKREKPVFDAWAR